MAFFKTNKSNSNSIKINGVLQNPNRNMNLFSKRNALITLDPYDYYLYNPTLFQTIISYHDKIHIFSGGSHKAIDSNGEYTSYSGISINGTYINTDMIPVIYKDELHLLGGFLEDDNHQITTYYRYHLKWNESADIWTKLPDLPYDFLMGTACEYKGELHIMSSMSNVGDYLDSRFYHYIWDGSSWRQSVSMPNVEVGQSMGWYYFHYNTSCVVDGKMYIGAKDDNVGHIFYWDGNSWNEDSIFVDYDDDRWAIVELNKILSINGSLMYIYVAKDKNSWIMISGVTVYEYDVLIFEFDIDENKMVLKNYSKLWDYDEKINQQGLDNFYAWYCLDSVNHNNRPYLFHHHDSTPTDRINRYDKYYTKQIEVSTNG